VENPWHGSILNKPSSILDDDLIIPDITDIPEIDKLMDLDADMEQE
jgi:hypothetical protein